jgi:hypothetical protein
MKRNGKMTAAAMGAVLAALVSLSCDTGTVPPNDTILDWVAATLGIDLRVKSTAPMTEDQKTAVTARIAAVINDGAFADYKAYMAGSNYKLSITIDNGAAAQSVSRSVVEGTATEGALSLTMEQALALDAAALINFLNGQGVANITPLSRTWDNIGGMRAVSRVPMAQSDKNYTILRIEEAFNTADMTWYKQYFIDNSFALTIYVENGGESAGEQGLHLTPTQIGQSAIDAYIKDYLNSVGIQAPQTQPDFVLNQSIAAYNNNALVVSRETMPDTEKTAIISAFTNAIHGADSWYKSRILHGAFVLKLYVENGGTTGTEEDGLHRTSAEAQAMTSDAITEFMISRGYEKPLEAEDTELVNEPLNGGRVLVSSSAVMSDADKTLVKSNIEAAVAGANWHLARLGSRNAVLTISVNNGGTNLTAGWVMTETEAKALTAQQVKDWLNANVADFKEETLTGIASAITAKSRVPLETSEKTAAQQKINNAYNDASFLYYKENGKTVAIWIENGETAQGGNNAVHITHANLTAATNTGFAETMANQIDGKANLNKTIPSEYIGTKATIKTDLWLTTTEWTTIKSNIEAALNAQNWWKDNVSASQLKVAVGGQTGGYANLTKTQANAGTSTIWPILKSFLETQTAFQSGNYTTTDDWTIYYRVPMGATQKGYVDQAITNLGWYKTNAQIYNKVYVNNGPDNLNDGGNGAVITGNPTDQSVVQNAIISFLNEKNINKPTEPTYDTFTLLNGRTNIDIKYDNRINFNTSEKMKIRDAYDFIVNNFSFNGKIVKLFVERDGTPMSVVVNGIHVAYEWLQQNHADELGILFNQWINMSETARAMSQKQDNLKIMLGNAVLASVMDGKLFMGDAFFDAVKDPAERKRIVPNKRGPAVPSIAPALGAQG